MLNQSRANGILSHLYTSVVRRCRTLNYLKQHGVPSRALNDSIARYRQRRRPRLIEMLEARQMLAFDLDFGGNQVELRISGDQAQAFNFVEDNSLLGQVSLSGLIDGSLDVNAGSLIIASNLDLAGKSLAVTAADRVLVGFTIGEQSYPSNWKPDLIHTDVEGTTINGSNAGRTGLKVDIGVDAKGNPTAVLVDPGTGYQVGDEIRFTDPASDSDATLTVKVLSIGAGATITTGLAGQDSGNISFAGEQIFVGPGSILNADLPSPGGHVPGQITLKATDRPPLALSLFTDTLDPLAIAELVNDRNAEVALSGATLSGRDIKIEAEGASKTRWDAVGEYGESIANGLMSQLQAIPALGISAALGVSGQFKVHEAAARIAFGDTQITSSTFILIDADAEADSSLNTVGINSSVPGFGSPVLVGVGFSKSDTTAKINVMGTSQVTAPGRIDITTTATSTAAVTSRTDGNTAASSNQVEFGFNIALALTNENSTILLGPESRIDAGDSIFNIDAQGNVVNNPTASISIFQDGSGAVALAIGVDNANISVDVHGSVRGNNAGSDRKLTFEGTAVNASNNSITISGIPAADPLMVGESLTYQADTDSPIEGLTDGRTYLVKSVSPPVAAADGTVSQTIELVLGATIDLDTDQVNPDATNRHTLSRMTILEFDKTAVSDAPGDGLLQLPTLPAAADKLTYLGPNSAVEMNDEALTFQRNVSGDTIRLDSGLKWKELGWFVGMSFSVDGSGVNDRNYRVVSLNDDVMTVDVANTVTAESVSSVAVRSFEVNTVIAGGFDFVSDAITFARDSVGDTLTLDDGSNWVDLGVTAGLRFAVSGTGDGADTNDGEYEILAINGSVLTVVASNTVREESFPDVRIKQVKPSAESAVFTQAPTGDTITLPAGHTPWKALGVAPGMKLTLTDAGENQTVTVERVNGRTIVLASKEELAEGSFSGFTVFTNQAVGIAGLRQNQEYQIERTAAGIKLIDPADPTARVDFVAPAGGVHGFVFVDHIESFHPKDKVNSQTNTIQLEANHPLKTGDLVFYDTDPDLVISRRIPGFSTDTDQPVSLPDAPIRGLTDNLGYFVVADSGNRIRLTTSAIGARLAEVIDLPASTGTHTLEREKGGIRARLDADNRTDSGVSLADAEQSWPALIAGASSFDIANLASSGARLIDQFRTSAAARAANAQAATNQTAAPAGKPEDKGMPIDISGTLAVTYFDHDVRTKIHSTAVIDSVGDLNVLADIKQLTKLKTVSSATRNGFDDNSGGGGGEDPRADTEIAVAVGIGLYNNDAQVIVDDGAKLDAAGAMTVAATVSYPLLVDNIVDAINPAATIESSGMSGLAPLLDGTLGIAAGLFNVETSAIAGSDDDKLAVGAAVVVTEYNNVVLASVGDNVQINQTVATQNADQSLEVTSELTAQIIEVGQQASINLSLPGFAEAFGSATPKKVKDSNGVEKREPFKAKNVKDFFTSIINPIGVSGKDSIGGIFLVNLANNSSVAKISDNAKIHTGDQFTNLNPATAVDLQNNIALPNPIGVETGDEVLYEVVSGERPIGGLVSGETYFAITDPATPNRIKLAASRDEALLGEAITLVGLAASPTPAVHRIRNKHSLRVTSTSDFFNVAVAQTGGSATRFGFSASVSAANIQSTTEASIGDGTTITSGALGVSASDTVDRINIDGAILTGKQAGIGVSIGVNIVSQDVDAFVGRRDTTSTLVQPTSTNITVAGPVDVNAIASGEIFSLVIAGAVQGLGDPEESNDDNSGPATTSVSLANSASGKEPKHTGAAAITVPVAVNVVDTNIQAYIDHQNILAGQVDVDARSELDVQAVVIGAAFALQNGKDNDGDGSKIDFGGAGAVGVNNAEQKVNAAISNSVITTTRPSAVSVVSRDDSEIEVDAGGFAVALARANQSGAALSFGVSVGINDLASTVQSTVLNSSITAATGNIVVMSESNPTIKAVTIAGAVSVRGSNKGTTGSFGGAGAGSQNNIESKSIAIVSGSTLNANAGSVLVTALDGSKISADGGGVAVAVALGKGTTIGGAVGIGLAFNEVTNTTSALIDGSNVIASKDVVVRADAKDAFSQQLLFSTVTNNSITSPDHGLRSGDVITYRNRNAPEQSIGGLVNGRRYYVIRLDDDRISLAATLEDTVDDPIAIVLTPSSGTNHALETTRPTIEAVAIGASIGVAAGKGTAVSLSGAGAGANNLIKNTITASVTNNKNLNREVRSNTGDVVVIANDASSIQVVSVGASVAVAASGGTGVAGAIGVSIARNEIDNTVTASSDQAKIVTTPATGGSVKIQALEDATIDAVSVAASIGVAASKGTGVALSGGGAEASNVILTDAHAKVVNSQIESADDVTIRTDNNASIQSRVAAVAVSVAGSGSTAGSLSIGASRARNFVGYQLDETPSASQSFAYAMNSAIVANDRLEILSSATASIDAGVGAGAAAISGSGTTALALSGAGVENRNLVKLDVNSYIDGVDGTGVKASSIQILANDSTSIKAVGAAASLAVGVGGTTGGAMTVGVSLSKNTVSNEVLAYIDNATKVETTSGDLAIKATSQGRQLFEIALTHITAAELDDVGTTTEDNKDTSGTREDIVDYDADVAILLRLRTLFKAAGYELEATDFAYLSSDNSVDLLESTRVKVVSGPNEGRVFLHIDGSRSNVNLQTENFGDRSKWAPVEDTEVTILDQGNEWSLHTSDRSYLIKKVDGELAVFESTIQATSIAVSVAAGFAGTTGIAFSGAGAESTNTILTKTNSFIRNSTIESAAEVDLDSLNTAGIVARVASATAALGGGGTTGVGAAIGIAVSRNYVGLEIDDTGTFDLTTASPNAETLEPGTRVKRLDGPRAGDIYTYIGTRRSLIAGNPATNFSIEDYTNPENWSLANLRPVDMQVHSFIVDSNIDSATGLSANAISDSTIDAGVGAGAMAFGVGGTVGVGVSAAGVGSENRIATNVQAYVDGNGSLGIEVGSLELHASDHSLISATTAAASLAFGGGGTVGVGVAIAISVALNEISNSVDAYIVNATKLETTSGSINILATEDARIQATSIAAALAASGAGVVAVSVAGAGAAAVNEIYTKTKAHIDLSTGIESADDINVEANNSSDIDATIVSAAVGIGIGGTVGVAVSIGIAVAMNKIGDAPGSSQILAFIDRSSLEASDDLNLHATSTASIDATVIAASLAVGGGFVGAAVAVAGVGVENLVASEIKAYIVGSPTTRIDASGSIDVMAMDTTAVTALVGAATVSISAGVFAGDASLAASISRTTVRNSIESYIRGATIKTIGGELRVQAIESATIDSNSFAGAVAASFSIGFSIAGGGAESTGKITSSVKSFIENSDLTIDGALIVDAKNTSDLNSKTSAIAISLALIGLAASGSVANAEVTPATDAFVKGSHVKAGDVTISSSATPWARANAAGLTVSTGLAMGVSTSTVDLAGSVNAYLDGKGKNISLGSLQVLSNIVQPTDGANRTVDSANAFAQGAAGGLLLGSNSTVTSATNRMQAHASIADDTVLNVSRTTTVSANTVTKQVADSSSIAIGLIAAGVTMATATSDLTTTAVVGTGVRLIGGGLSVTATGSDDNFAKNIAGAGGAIAGAAAVPRTVNTSTTLAEVKGGSGSLIDVSVDRDRDNILDSADVDSLDVNNNGIPDNVDVQFVTGEDLDADGIVDFADSEIRLSATNIIRRGVDEDEDGIRDEFDIDRDADGIIDSADALVLDVAFGVDLDKNGIQDAFDGHSRANRDAGLGLFTLGADHLARFNTQVITAGLGILSGAGADLDNTVTSRVEAKVGNGAKIDARQVAINATNRVDKPDMGDAGNVDGLAGGLIAGVGIESDTTLNLDTQVIFGTGAEVHVVGKTENAGSFQVAALNIINAVDRVTLRSGGLAAGGTSNSTIETPIDSATGIPKNIAKVDVRGNATLASVGTIDVSARGNGNIKIQANAETYGAATASTGTSRIAIKPWNEVAMGSGTTIRADGDVNISTGTNTDFQRDRYEIESRIDTFAGSAIPLDFIDAEAFLLQNNRITVSSGALVESAGNVRLHAERLGLNNVLASAKAVNWVSEVGDAIDGIFGAGGGVEAFDGTADSAAYGLVIVDGVVRTGIKRNRILEITSFDPVANTIETLGATTGDVPFSTKLSKVKSSLEVSIEAAETQLLRYRNNPQLRAFYESEITRMRGLLAQQGLLQRPTVAKPGVTIPDGYLERVEQFALTVSIDPIVAQAGFIDVRGDQLFGSGTLDAPTDASVQIINHTPVFIEIEGITVPEQTGGLFLNGDEVSDAGTGSLADVRAAITAVNVASVAIDNERLSDGESPQVTGVVAFVRIVGGGAANEPSILVDNVADVTSPEITQGGARTFPWPSISVVGEINNLSGDLILRNFNAGAGSISITAPVRAKTPQILAGIGGTAVIDQPDLGTSFEVGGASHSHWNALTGGNGTVPAEGPPIGLSQNVTNFLNTIPTNVSLFGERVFITAEYININGIIQSGRDVYNLTIGQATANEIAFRKFFGATGIKTLNSASNQDFRVRFDFSKNRIIVEELRVSGGFVDLTGHIANTHNGEIRVLGDYGSIRIDNQTNFDIQVNRLDVTNRGEGTLVIKDKAKGTPGAPEVTIYQKTADQVTVTTSAGSSPGSNNMVYQPQDGWRYGWTIAADQIERTTNVYRTSSWLGLDFIAPDPEDLHSSTTEPKGPPKLVDAGPYFFRDTSDSSRYNYGFEEIVTSSPVTTLCCNHTTYNWIGTATFHQTEIIEQGTRQFHTHTIEADRPIDIRFIGLSEGRIEITSRGNVIIEGPMSNPSGVTRIDTQRSIFQQSDDGAVGGRRIELVAGNSIGLGRSALLTNVSDSAPFDFTSASLPPADVITGVQGDSLTISPGHRVRLSNDYIGGGEPGEVYKYLGGRAQIALGRENYANTARWQKIDLVASLNAETISGAIRITETIGDLPVDSVLAGGRRDVFVTAQGSIVVGKSSATTFHQGLIFGGAIQLTAGGDVGELISGGGSLDRPILLDTGNTLRDSLSAQAGGDLFVREVIGDLAVNQVIAGGDVVVHVLTGELVDANDNSVRDERTIEELTGNVWGDLQLTEDLGFADKRQERLDAISTEKEQLYFAYWNFRNTQPNPTVYDPTHQVTLSTEERSFYESDFREQGIAQGLSGAELEQFIADGIETLENSRTSQYHNLHTLLDADGLVSGLFDPNFEYEPTLDDIAKIDASMKVWTVEELLYSFSIGLFVAVSDTQVDIEEANIQGRNVTLLAGGGIGRTDGEVTIDLSTRPVSLSTEQRITLASAERNDVVYLSQTPTEAVVHFFGNSITRVDGSSWLSDGFAVGQFIQVEGRTVNATDTGTFYQVAAVSAGTLTLAAGTSLATEFFASVRVAPVVLDPRAPGVTIAQIQVLLREDVDIEATGQITATSGSQIFIGSESTVNLNQLVAGSLPNREDIRVKTAGDINDANSSNSPNVMGRNVVLESGQGRVGSLANPIYTDLSASGTVTARANNEVVIEERNGFGTAGDLRVGTIFSRTSFVRLDADASLVDGLNHDFTNIQANEIFLYATLDIGQAGNHLDTDAVGFGTITATAGRSIWIAETNGNMNVRNILARTGDVDLRAQFSILDAVDLNDPTDPESGNAAITPGNPRPDVLGNNIRLSSTFGTIGEPGNDLDIESRLNGQGTLTSFSDDNTYIIEVTGDLHLFEVSTNGASAFLSAPTASILNGNATGANVLSGKLWLFAADDIGRPLAPIRSSVANLEGIAVDGKVFIENLGGLSVGNVAEQVNGQIAGGIVAGSGIYIAASSPVTIFENLTSGRQIVVIARDDSDDTIDNFDHITVLENRVLRTTDAAGVSLPGLIEGATYIVERFGSRVVLRDEETGAVVDLQEPLDSTTTHFLTPARPLESGISTDVLADFESYAFTGTDVDANNDRIEIGSNSLSSGDRVLYTTSGTIALLAGDDVIIQSLARIEATNAVLVRAGFGDNDAVLGSVRLDGAIVNAGTFVDMTATGDILNENATIIEAGTDASFEAGNDFFQDETSTIVAQDRILIAGDVSNNDPGEGTVIEIFGRLRAIENIIHGDSDDDHIYLSPVELVWHTRIFGFDGNDLITLDQLPSIETMTNRPSDGLDRAVRDTVDVDGGGGSDAVIAFVSGGRTSYLVNVQDSGRADDGTDTLSIYGTEVGAEANPSGNDLFLLRKNFVAYLNPVDPIGVDVAPGVLHPEVERFNCDRSINGRLIVSTESGDDQVYIDDNSTITTVDGGLGDDFFQIGQVFGEEPTGIATDVDGIDLTSDDDSIELTAITSGFLSNGISHPAVIFGGEGKDTFSVYSNRAALRLEGEDGNDFFVIRSFALQEAIIVGGGNGDDRVEYNINAPVSINGGAGFDTVVAIGTELDDTFIITEDGIFGAGLNIQIDGVEEALEVDGLEGDDTFFILSTRPGVITTLIGGLGSDTFNVTGDVTQNVTSPDFAGVSGRINHGALSGLESPYNNLLVDGVQVAIATETQGAVVIEPSGGSTRVIEGSTEVDEYFISLSSPIVGSSTVAFLTVSAAMASSADRRRDKRSPGLIDAGSVLISIDGGTTYLQSAVIAFDSSNWSSPRSVFVRAIDDDSIEGSRNVVISHSVAVESIDPAVPPNADDVANFDEVAVENLVVEVIDNDLGGIIITPTDGETLVLEGNSLGEIQDSYSVVLTVQPTEDVVVEIDNSSFAGQLDSIPSLIFTPGNWDQPQTVFVRAINDDIPENPQTVRITHRIISDDPVYSGVAAEVHDVRVEDDDSAGVLVRETNGRTRVIKNGPGDSYSLRLVSDPLQPVTISLFLDEAVLVVPSSRVTFNASTGRPEVTFDSSNWFEEVFVELEADPDFVVDPDSQLNRQEPSRQHLAARLQGPLAIEGGVAEGRDRTLRAAVVLPTESAIPPKSVAIDTNESERVDRLNVFNDSSAADDNGMLSTTADWPNQIITLGDAANGVLPMHLSGLGMGTGHEVDLSDAQDGSQVVSVPGGITFDDIEITEVLLGIGNDRFNVSATSPGTPGARDNILTMIHGGGGDDTLTITGGGGPDSPLVILGDTFQDGRRYDFVPSTGVITGNATVFANPGNDIIDASASPFGVIVYGGAGDDLIIGSQFNDQLAGGSGNDTIKGGDGQDHIYGDSGFNLDSELIRVAGQRHFVSRISAYRSTSIRLPTGRLGMIWCRAAMSCLAKRVLTLSLVIMARSRNRPVSCESSHPTLSNWLRLAAPASAATISLMVAWATISSLAVSERIRLQDAMEPIY